MKSEQPLWPGATYNVIFASCSLRLVLTRSGAGSASGSKRPAAAPASRKRALERKRRLWLGLLDGVIRQPAMDGDTGRLVESQVDRCVDVHAIKRFAGGTLSVESLEIQRAISVSQCRLRY